MDNVFVTDLQSLSSEKTVRRETSDSLRLTPGVETPSYTGVDVRSVVRASTLSRFLVALLPVF